MVVLFLRLLLAIASTILLLLSVSTSTVALLRVLEGTLAGLAVDVDPSVVTVVPFGDPWGRDLGRAVVVVGLRGVGLLASTILAFFELVNELFEERHRGRVVSWWAESYSEWHAIWSIEKTSWDDVKERKRRAGILGF
jgi:hypothetical protein